MSSALAMRATAVKIRRDALVWAIAIMATVSLLGLTGLLSAAHAAETIIYLHNDVSGTPQAATDSSGNLLWKETDPVNISLSD